jgi:hypothetical protein
MRLTYTGFLGKPSISVCDVERKDCQSVSLLGINECRKEGAALGSPVHGSPVHVIARSVSKSFSLPSTDLDSLQTLCLSDIRGNARRPRPRPYGLNEACCASQPGALQVAVLRRSSIQDTCRPCFSEIKHAVSREKAKVGN